MGSWQPPPQKQGSRELVSKSHQGCGHNPPNGAKQINHLQRHLLRPLWASLTLSSIILSPRCLGMKEKCTKTSHKPKAKPTPSSMQQGGLMVNFRKMLAVIFKRNEHSMGNFKGLCCSKMGCPVSATLPDCWVCQNQGSVSNVSLLPCSQAIHIHSHLPCLLGFRT